MPMPLRAALITTKRNRSKPNINTIIEESRMCAKYATEILEHEHHYIQRAVGVMTLLAETVAAGEKVEADTLRDLIDFMRRFGDICHHGKEEDCLFPLLAKKGVPQHGCPIGGLLHEHEAGRALVKQLAKDAAGYAKGDRLATESLVNSLRALAELYLTHIWKEDYLLFPMTNKILSPKEQQALVKKFAHAEKRLGGKTHRHFELLVEKLEQAAETAPVASGHKRPPRKASRTCRSGQ
jgi:hemerythrin-like domain-containing protein